MCQKGNYQIILRNYQTTNRMQTYSRVNAITLQVLLQIFFIFLVNFVAMEKQLYHASLGIISSDRPQTLIMLSVHAFSDCTYIQTCVTFFHSFGYIFTHQHICTICVNKDYMLVFDKYMTSRHITRVGRGCDIQLLSQQTNLPTLQLENRSRK